MEFYKNNTQGNVLIQVKEVSSNPGEECLRIAITVMAMIVCLGKELQSPLGAANTDPELYLVLVSSDRKLCPEMNQTLACLSP